MELAVEWLFLLYVIDKYRDVIGTNFLLDSATEFLIVLPVVVILEIKFKGFIFGLCVLLLQLILYRFEMLSILIHEYDIESLSTKFVCELFS